MSNFMSGRLVSDGFAYTGSAIRVWDALSNEEKSSFQLTDAQTLAYEFEPFETLIGVGTGSAADLILLWNTDTDDVYNTNLNPAIVGVDIQVTSAEASTYELSPDENFLAAGTNNGLVVIWDFKTGEQLKTLQSGQVPVRKITWSSDGNMLISSSNDGVMLWDVSQILN
jgi:WD40 repeat protein